MQAKQGIMRGQFIQQGGCFRHMTGSAGQRSEKLRKALLNRRNYLVPTIVTVKFGVLIAFIFDPLQLMLLGII